MQEKIRITPWRKRIYGQLLPGLLIGALALGLILRPALVLENGQKAIETCLRLLIPSLFPFFVVSRLLLEGGWAAMAGRCFAPVMQSLFGVSGSCAPAFVLGMVGGYPVGARTAIEMYRQGQCSREEAERLLGFCSNCGPAFILGTVGSAVFGSARAGLTLYAVHMAASVCIGIGLHLLCGRARPMPGVAGATKSPETPDFPQLLTRSVTEAARGTLGICAFVVLFAVGNGLFFSTGAAEALTRVLGRLLTPLGLGQTEARLLLHGVLDMTSGVLQLGSAAGSLTARMTLAACLLGWAGFCVHCQVLTFAAGSGLRLRPYFLGKLVHGVLSGALTAVLLRLFPVLPQPAALLRERMAALSAATLPGTLLSGFLGAVLCLWLLWLPTARRR